MRSHASKSHRQFRSRIESLEPRVLLAGDLAGAFGESTALVQDANANVESIQIQERVQLNNEIIVLTKRGRGVLGRVELWKTDLEGTTATKIPLLGVAINASRGLISVGDHVYFVANAKHPTAQTSEVAVWSTDGETVTKRLGLNFNVNNDGRVTDIDLAKHGELLLATVSQRSVVTDENPDSIVYSSTDDGMLSLVGNFSGQRVDSLAVIGSDVYTITQSTSGPGIHDSRLWKDRTLLVRKEANFNNLFSKAGLVYFKEFGSLGGPSVPLWQSDGTVEGTGPVDGDFPTPDSPHVVTVPSISPQLFPEKTQSTQFLDLFQSDLGTVVASVQEPGQLSAQDALGLLNDDATGTIDLFVTGHGLMELVREVKAVHGNRIVKKPNLSTTPEFVSTSGVTAFEFPPEFTPSQLIETDGTQAGTRMLSGLTLQEHLSKVGQHGDDEILSDRCGNLWSLNQELLQRLILADNCENTRLTVESTETTTWFSSTPAGRSLARDRTGGLWTTDGTAEKTKQVATEVYNDFVVHMDVAYFVGARHQLWSSDGTQERTMRLVELPDNRRILSNLMLIDGKLVFSDDAHGLWVSDGTPDGTTLLAQFVDGGTGSRFLRRYNHIPTPDLVTRYHAGYSPLEELTAIGDQVFFSANDGEHGTELWVTNGTVEGTRLAADIMPGPQSSVPVKLVAAEDRLVFIANDGQHGDELWSVDLSAPIDPLPGDVDGNNTVDFADFLILSANFGKETNDGITAGDFDNDNRVLFSDFLILSANFGTVK